ncbi:MAG: RES domain-containing protein [Nitriliruptor sp.]|nr:MAG: RES domain-containing protein [Nitriliruptor sp.]
MAARRRGVTLLVWPQGRSFVRAHSHAFGSTEFDRRADPDARFSPLRHAGAGVGVIYGGTDDRVAAAETIFHRLPGQGRPRRVPLDRYRAWQWSEVLARRDLLLLPLDATLPGAGTLVDGNATTYRQARAQASELLRDHPRIDGFVWASHQLADEPSSVTIDIVDTGLCVLLIEDTHDRDGGVSRADLDAAGPSVPFATAEGLERLDAIGDALDVTVVRA